MEKMFIHKVDAFTPGGNAIPPYLRAWASTLAEAWQQLCKGSPIIFPIDTLSQRQQPNPYR